MTQNLNKHEDPIATFERLRKRVLGGSNILLDSLTADEMVAANDLIAKGEAEIVSSACRPFLVAKLDRIIIA